MISASLEGCKRSGDRPETPRTLHHGKSRRARETPISVWRRQGNAQGNAKAAPRHPLADRNDTKLGKCTLDCNAGILGIRTNGLLLPNNPDRCSVTRFPWEKRRGQENG